MCTGGDSLKSVKKDMATFEAEDKSGLSWQEIKNKYDEFGKRLDKLDTGGGNNSAVNLVADDGTARKKLQESEAAYDVEHHAKLLETNQDEADAVSDTERRYLRSRLLKMGGIDSTFLTGASGSKPKGSV